MNKKDLSERDICTRFITPALVGVGWTHSRFREEVKLTDGRGIVRGKLAYRLQNPAAKGGPKRADYVLYAKGNIPIAVIEAKRAIYDLGHGMQQALDYAEMLDAPIAIRSNGDGFLLHDRTGITEPTEREPSLIDGYLDAKPKYRPGINSSPGEKMEERLRRIRELTQRDAELSSVALWCVRFRNDDRLLRLVSG